MLKGQNVICISSIDWDFIWQGHQEIMSTLAMHGNRVLFIENTGARSPGLRDISRIKHRIENWFKGVKGIRKEMDNIYIFSPLVLPFPYSRIARWVNHHLIFSILERWMKAMDFSDPVIWTFLPTPLSLDIVDSLIKKLVIYYCIDNLSVSSVAARKIKRSEESLLKKADLIFVTSKELYNYCIRYKNRVYNFPFAVNFSEFEKIRLQESGIPEELKDIKRPIIGYVGGLHKWVDQNLIKETAEKFPEYSFVFIGPIQSDVSTLLCFKNIYFLGQKRHEELPLFIKYFDICSIPYLITDFTKNVYPTKLNEYLALGKPVISTYLPEVMSFNREFGNIVYVAEDIKQFGEYIRIGIAENKEPIRNKRIQVASQNSWENRIEEMSGIIEKEIEKKRLDRDVKWKENLVVFYRRTRRRLLKVSTICLLLYFLLFKTPFIWFLASPLKISDQPQRVDAIVVFGGGVGETGSPGKSTIERARYAAEFYKDGYADKIIFSSGYTYRYNDAENMRLIALSVGVADKDIILEQNANSTYENVIFSKRILDRNKWDSILLVSSPYNMRRAYLVFNRWRGTLQIFYRPVQESQFYDRSYGVNWEQMKAIMHEYLGIMYYWFKGYIR
jgi:uncharacterized SAM-binding protein YcdF (DUF218 family)